MEAATEVFALSAAEMNPQHVAFAWERLKIERALYYLRLNGPQFFLVVPRSKVVCEVITFLFRRHHFLRGHCGDISNQSYPRDGCPEYAGGNR